MRFTRRSLAALPGISASPLPCPGSSPPSGRTGQLEHLGGQVLHDGGDVDGGLGADAHVVGVLVAQEPEVRRASVRFVPVDTADRELWGG
jgi:hypothetical protein